MYVIPDPAEREGIQRDGLCGCFKIKLGILVVKKMHYKKTFCAIITAVILISNTYSQYKDIPTEIRKPVKILGLDEDEVIFYRPNDIKFNRLDNNIYVADTYNDRIVVLNPDLNFKKEFGNLGQGPGEFNKPYSIEFDNEGNNIVLDFLNSRIQTVDGDGKYISSFTAEFSTYPEIIIPR